MLITRPTSQHLNYLKQQGYTQKDIGKVYQRTDRMVRYWKKDNGENKKKVGRKGKLTENHLIFLENCITSIKAINQKHLAWYFSLLMGKPISQPTICRALKKIRTTYKKASYQALEQLRKKNQEKIKHFIEVIIPSLLKSNANIFFLDECSFRCNSAPRRGYSRKGSRLVLQKPGNKGKNQSLILLTQITKGDKIIHWELVEGGVNSEIFHKFLSDFNPPNNGKKNVLIMDNLSVHKAKDSCIDLGLTPIRELLASKNIEVIYLPSYTPELNPVEKMNNILRQDVETWQPRAKNWLKLIIKEKMNFFQKENLNKYLDNSIKECLMKNPNINEDEHDYITLEKFNVRLGMNETVKIRVDELWPQFSELKLEKNDEPIHKIAKINTLLRLSERGN
jgi:transposase